MSRDSHYDFASLDKSRSGEMDETVSLADVLAQADLEAEDEDI